MDTSTRPDGGPRLELGPVRWHPGEHSPVFTFGHRLAGDVRLGLDALAALAERLEPDQVEVAEFDGASAGPGFRTRRWHGPGAAAAVSAVPEGRRWIALHHVERDPTYRALVDELFGEFVVAARVPAGVVLGTEGYVFVSSSQTTVPFHIDHEHNLFLQVQGEKHFSVGEFPDDARRAETLEAMYSDGSVDVDYEPAGVVTHALRSGDGLYVAPDAVHGVRTAGEMSISLSLVWTTTDLQRAGRVYAVNHHLRRLRLSPRLPGRSTAADSVKSFTATAWRRAKGLRR
jgi:hypothetical protein